MRGLHERADLDVLVHGDRDVLSHGRVGDDVLVHDALRDGREERCQVKLERAPGALEHGGMKLSEGTGVCLRRLARVKLAMRATPYANVEMERAVQRLENAFRLRVSALEDPAQMPALVRELLARRKVDACDLEQGEVFRTRVEPGARCVDEAREKRRAKNGLVSAHRIRKPDRSGVGVRRDEAPRVRLQESGSDEDVLDQPPQTLVA